MATVKESASSDASWLPCSDCWTKRAGQTPPSEPPPTSQPESPVSWISHLALDQGNIDPSHYYSNPIVKISAFEKSADANGS